MPKVCYVQKKFTPAHQRVIDQANAICAEYVEQGLVLTLRQLYYQFVARDLIPNLGREYDRLQGIMNDARLAGEFDWDWMIDRTRGRVERPHWDNPGVRLEQVAKGYHEDLWAEQGVRPLVFVEKDAAVGVIEGVCHENDVPYLSCRGYTSASALWEMAQKIRWYIENGDRVVVLHVGDHDPSGLDMTRDLRDRISRFLWKDWLLTWGQLMPRPVTVGAIKSHMIETMNLNGDPFVVKRIALNIDQIEQYEPPPNFAKTTDARFRRYQEETGLDESWELDALEPNILINLIQNEIDALRDEEKWANAYEKMEQNRRILTKMHNHYQPVINFLETLS